MLTSSIGDRLEDRGQKKRVRPPEPQHWEKKLQPHKTQRRTNLLNQGCAAFPRILCEPGQASSVLTHSHMQLLSQKLLDSTGEKVSESSSEQSPTGQQALLPPPLARPGAEKPNAGTLGSRLRSTAILCKPQKDKENPVQPELSKQEAVKLVSMHNKLGSVWRSGCPTTSTPLAAKMQSLLSATRWRQRQTRTRGKRRGGRQAAQPLTCPTGRVGSAGGWSGHIAIRFPISRPTLAAQWVQNLGRKSFAPTSNTCLCSEHFLPECFRDYNGRQFLREDAVPTIFRPTEPRALRGGATAKEPSQLKRQRFGAMSELEKAQEREKARLRQRERRLRLKEMSAASFTKIRDTFWKRTGTLAWCSAREVAPGAGSEAPGCGGDPWRLTQRKPVSVRAVRVLGGDRCHLGSRYAHESERDGGGGGRFCLPLPHPSRRRRRRRSGWLVLTDPCRAWALQTRGAPDPPPRAAGGYWGAPWAQALSDPGSPWKKASLELATTLWAWVRNPGRLHPGTPVFTGRLSAVWESEDRGLWPRAQRPRWGRRGSRISLLPARGPRRLLPYRVPASSPQEAAGGGAPRRASLEPVARKLGPHSEGAPPVSANAIWDRGAITAGLGWGKMRRHGAEDNTKTPPHQTRLMPREERSAVSSAGLCCEG
ncbi:THAP3 protein, partial [Atractosteus spatula]|nr:THAP3 protein [Atractosteus spatula]